MGGNSTITRNLPESWRTNPDFLESFAKALDERPKISTHLLGEVNSSGNAVGCHLSDAVDNIKVMQISPQPAGFPKNYPDGSLKEAYIQIKNSSGVWITKSTKSSFFPAGWTEDKVLEEMAFVKSVSGNKVTERNWKGLASDNATIIEVFYMGPINNLTFSTTYPFFPK